MKVSQCLFYILNKRRKHSQLTVKDEIHTSPLLHHLKRRAEDRLAEIRVGLPQRALEATSPATKPRCRRDQSLLVLLVGNDLGQFVLHKLGLLRLPTQFGQGSPGLGDAATLDKVPRRVREEQDARPEDEGPDELDADGQSVRGPGGPVGGGVGDARRHQEADGDAELIARDEGTAHFSWANLRHVQDDRGTLEPGTQAGNQAADDDGGVGVAVARDDLDNHTDDEDGARHDDGPPAADGVGHVAGCEGAEEGADGHDGHDEGFMAGSKFGGARALYYVDPDL